MTAANLSDRTSRRIGIVELVSFSTLLFPKAGMNLQGIPLTMNLFLVAILILVCIFRYSSYLKMNDIILLSFILPWILLCLTRSNALIENRTLRFGSFYWFVLVPIFWVSANNLRRSGRKISPKLVIYCSFGATLFGIGQFVWGLNFLKITGLTIAWGDSYERKNLSIFDSSTTIGTKIPSTFQGGNIWGQCSSVVLIWVVVFKVWRIFESRLLQIASVISPAVAVFLSFSRTAVVASIFSLALYFLRDRRRGLGVGAFLGIVGLLAFFTSKFSQGRYSVESFSNSAGRSTQWLAGLTNFSLNDWIFGRSNILPDSAFHMEGILGLFGQVGILGFLLILLLWITTFKGSFAWLGLPTLICVILDSTYLTPPLLLFPSILFLARFPGDAPQYLEFQR
jgi:hypothetical protein